MAALKDPMWAIRQLAVRRVGTLAQDAGQGPGVRSQLEAMARTDAKADVRDAALRALHKYFDDASLMDLYLAAVGDSSYNVMGRALIIVYDQDPDRGAALAAGYENSGNEHVRKVIFDLYAQDGHDENFDFMTRTLPTFSGGTLYAATAGYARFLTRCKLSNIEKGYPRVVHLAEFGDPWFVRMAGMQGLSDLARHCEKEAAANASDSALAGAYTKLQKTIEQSMKRIRENEENENLRRMYGSGAH
jgi:hypothetical protein